MELWMQKLALGKAIVLCYLSDAGIGVLEESVLKSFTIIFMRNNVSTEYSRQIGKKQLCQHMHCVWNV